jgi:hypothetical protein
MTFQDGISDAFRQFGLHVSRRSNVTEQRRLIEAAHMHRPFDHLTFSAEREATRRRGANDRHAAQV